MSNNPKLRSIDGGKKEKGVTTVFAGFSFIVLFCIGLGFMAALILLPIKLMLNLF